MSMGSSDDSRVPPLVQSLTNFKVSKKLSEGRFSKVVLAETPQDHQSYAIKIIKQHDKPTINYQSYNSLARVQTEIKIMKFLGTYRHPHILQLFNVITSSKEIDNTYNQSKIYLILEYCARGEINFKKLSSLSFMLRAFRSIVLAVEFLHLNDIIHRDIKPSNILIAEDGTIKLSDFGISYRLTGDNSVDQFALSSTLGTPLFIPPELCTFKEAVDDVSSTTILTSPKLKCKLDSKIDIWSLGVTFYWLIFQHFPYFSNNEYKLFNKIVQDPLAFGTMNSCPIFNVFSIEQEFGHGEKIILFTSLCDLIDKMMNKNPSKRFSIEQAKKSDALTYGLIEKERKDYLKFNQSFVQPNKEVSQSSISSVESALSRLRLRKKKMAKQRPSPIDILAQLDSKERSEQSLVQDVPEFQPQHGDEMVSDLDTSSSSGDLSNDSDFVNNASTHQLFAPRPSERGRAPLNSSALSLPLFDNRLSDNTILTDVSGNDGKQQTQILMEPPRLGYNGGNNSAPITPLSPTYTSQIHLHHSPVSTDLAADIVQKTKEEKITYSNNGKANSSLSRSKGAYNLSKITTSKGLNDLHSLLASESKM